MTARRIARRANRLRGTGDAGVTLLEVVVSMSIMSIVMAVFTTGFLSMYRSANRTEAMAVGQQQVTVAFERLDKEIRYASAISAPNVTGPDRYVEYLTTVTGVARCSELRLDRTDSTNVRLRLRTWDQGLPPPAWNKSPVLASNVSSAEPFSLTSDGVFQGLHLRLDVNAGSGGSASTSRTDVTFAALNSDFTTAAAYATVCTEGRSYS